MKELTPGSEPGGAGPDVPADVTKDTGAISGADRRIPPPTWTGKTLKPDLRIDLTSESAADELDKLHAALGSAAELGESAAVTPEDEADLEQALAEHDAQQAKLASDPIGQALRELRDQHEAEQIKKELEQTETGPHASSDDADESDLTKSE